MNSLCKYIFLSIIVSTLTLFISQFFFKNQNYSYEDCVLSGIKNTKEPEIIKEITNICKSKFNIQFEDWNKEEVKKK